ncbi:MAG: MMPL family transporter [Pseudomonadales bacterium]|nr:MMPL family transporter [Pseudomonadales bacterium]
MESSIVNRIFSHRGLLLTLSFLFIAAASSGLQHIKFDGSTEFFFGEQHPNMVLWRQFSDTYGSANRALIMLKSKNGDSLLETQYLAAMEETTHQLEQIPFIIRVDSLTNYQYSRSVGDDIFVAPLVEDATQLSAEALQHIQSVALTDPALQKRLISVQGDTLVAVMTGAFNKELGEVELQKLEVAADLYAIRDDLRQRFPELDVYINGNIVGNAVTMKIAMDDIQLYIPLMYLIIYSLLALLLRSVVAMLTIAVTATICTVSSLGIASWLGITLSPLSLSSASIIVITTVAHCVHIVIAYLESFRVGNTKVDALKESYRINLQPIFFTSLTTALGFLSMNISEMQPARDLGNIVAIGVVISFIFSLTLLPSFLLIMPINKRMKNASKLHQFSDVICQFVIRHPTKLLLSSFMVAAVLAALASTNIVTERMTENIKYPHPFRTSVDAFDEKLGGVYTIQYSLQSGESSGISEPEYLSHLEAFSSWLRQQDNISNVYAYSDIIKRLNRNMHGDDEAFFKIPASRELAAQYLLMYEFSLPAGQDLNNQISQDRSSTRMIISIPTMDAVTLIALQEKIYQWQQQNLPKTMQDYGTSSAAMWSHLSINVLNNSLLSAFTALFLISMVLMGILRSFKYGLISLAPNMLPGIAGFGFWALYSGEINLALMSVLSITIGIVVDDTVHFLSKYIRARKEQGLDAEKAVAYAFKQVGPAITVTTIVLVAGFGSLSMSPFLANSNMGIIIAVIICAALLYDFFLLPALLLVVDKKK